MSADEVTNISYGVTVMILSQTLTESYCSEIILALMIFVKSEDFVLLILTEQSQMHLQTRRF